MLPCWANQNPNFKPPRENWSRKSERTIPKPKEITNLIREKTSADVRPSQIILKEEPNKIGTYSVDINFHSEVKATISIKIDKIQSK